MTDFSAYLMRRFVGLSTINRLTVSISSPRSEGVCYATGEEWRRTTNTSRKRVAAGQSQNDAQWMHLVMKVKSDDEKKQYCIGTWRYLDS